MITSQVWSNVRNGKTDWQIRRYKSLKLLHRGKKENGRDWRLHKEGVLPEAHEERLKIKSQQITGHVSQVGISHKNNSRLISIHGNEFSLPSHPKCKWRQHSGTLSRIGNKQKVEGRKIPSASKDLGTPNHLDMARSPRQDTAFTTIGWIPSVKNHQPLYTLWPSTHGNSS